MTIQVGDLVGGFSDGGAHTGFDLGKAMEAKTQQVPADCPLPGSGQLGVVPFTVVEDEAFPGQHLLRWRIVNYGLSIVRMVVQYAFGTLAAR